MKIPSSRSKARAITLTIDSFKGGTNTLMDEARMPAYFAVQSNNLMQTADSVWKTRWGTAEYGAEHASTIDGASEYLKADGTTELITISNGKAYKSVDGGALTEISGATFTPGYQCYFLQMGGYDSSNNYWNYLYIANGKDTLARYDGNDIHTYSALEAPKNLTASLVASGLSSGTFTYYAEVTALNDVGETIGSNEASITCNKERENWIADTDKGISWRWDAVAGASRYQLYLDSEAGHEALLVSVPGTSTDFTDDGSLDINPYVTPPEQNTTPAPKFKSMCVSGNRIWATNDPGSRYTVYFSGTGRQIGNFSDFYGGGWINLEKGGREIPVAVKHYQTGAGEGRLTVLCKTPDGHGAVWQIVIADATVGDSHFSIPSAIKVFGSFGTESILGVVATDNDIAFPNRKGWFTLGPERNFYGILRTSERSSNIRPYWRNLISKKIGDIAAYFYDAKIFISVPTSTTGNNRIIVYDTERSNWAVDWTIGAKQFLEYTDTGNKTRLLCVPPSGKRMVEISENIMNDKGIPFHQSYISPLLPVSKTKTDIMNLKEAIVELAKPKGAINFSVLGLSKDNSFATLASRTITSFAADTGVGVDLLSGTFLTSTCDNASGGEDLWEVIFTKTPTTYAQATTKVAIRKRAKVYALQFKVSSSTANTDFTILNLQAKGTLVPRRLPSAWLS